MAGLGYKDFTAGAVLTAAQVDGYLMEQSVMNFAGTAARGSALASVLSAGQMAHVGGGTVTVYDGSAWQQVYPAQAGLVYIAGTACGTAASVSINNCFTSTYNVYRIMIERAAKSPAGAVNFFFRLRLSGTDATSNYNHQYVNASSTTVAGARRTSNAEARFASINADGECAVTLDIFSPAIAATTTYVSKTLYNLTPEVLDYAGNHTTATAYDGITFYPETGSFSGGTVRVYGYRNS